LEDEFWNEFKEIADDLDLPINALVAQIDADRGMEAGLASAIRVFVLRTLKERLPTSE
jgi:predicted DNA-binding ribbon-helix-helix protein